MLPSCGCTFGMNQVPIFSGLRSFAPVMSNRCSPPPGHSALAAAPARSSVTTRILRLVPFLAGQRHRVGLVDDVDGRVDDLADLLRPPRVGRVEDQRLRQRAGVGAGAAGVEGDVVRLRAQRGRHERDAVVAHLLRPRRSGHVVDRDARLGAGDQVGVGVVEVAPARVDRHVVRAARGRRGSSARTACSEWSGRQERCRRRRPTGRGRGRRWTPRRRRRRCRRRCSWPAPGRRASTPGCRPG